MSPDSMWQGFGKGSASRKTNVGRNLKVEFAEVKGNRMCGGTGTKIHRQKERPDLSEHRKEKPRLTRTTEVP